MTKIWNEAGFVDNDPFVIETEEVKAADGQKPVLSLEAFLEKAEGSNENGLAVLIKPADDVVKLKPWLDRLALVAVAFPAYNDGRAFSHAALLRSRLGFGGDVRAVGDVLIDQIPLMQRCGISSFAVTNAVALQRLAEGRLPGISRHYQPAIAAEPAPQGKTYSWRRVDAPAA